LQINPPSENDNNSLLPNIMNPITPQNDEMNITNSIKDIKTWCAIKAGSLKGAIEFNTNLDKNMKLSNPAYFLSYQLQNSNNIPPITFTTYNTPHKTYLLSQVINYDRYVLNLLDNRCPKIRNTVQWSMKMTQTDKIDTSACFAWQCNRNIALGCHLTSNGILSSRLSIKRWAYPRLLANITYNINVSNLKSSFGGVGIVMETGSGEDAMYNDFVYDKEEMSGPDMKLVLEESVFRKKEREEGFDNPPSFV